MKGIEQRLTAGNNRVDHQFMTALGEDCRHLIADNGVEQGYECARSRVDDDVGLRRLAGDLFNQIVKAARINTPAFVRTLDQIEFRSV